MERKFSLEPVIALPTDFSKRETLKAVESRANDAVNQSFLFIEMVDGQLLNTIRGAGVTGFYSESSDLQFLKHYQERLAFWMEREVRNNILNVESGKFCAPNDAYLERMIRFYEEAFLENKPLDLYMHRMPDADKADAHSHLAHDKVFVFNDPARKV